MKQLFLLSIILNLFLISACENKTRLDSVFVPIDLSQAVKDNFGIDEVKKIQAFLYDRKHYIIVIRTRDTTTEGLDLSRDDVYFAEKENSNWQFEAATLMGQKLKGIDLTSSQLCQNDELSNLGGIDIYCGKK